MTNETRQMVRDLDQANEYERELHCCVRQPDAGGRCERTATIRTHETLNFCPEHGEEAKLGALQEAYQEADNFFGRLKNPHVPDINAIVEHELRAVVNRMRSEGPSDEDYHRALVRAYPNPPERVRKMIRQWERDEWNSDGLPPFDLLLDSLFTIRKLMRISFEDGEDWLTEILEDQHQETAARAACAALLHGVRPA